MPKYYKRKTSNRKSHRKASRKHTRKHTRKSIRKQPKLRKQSQKGGASDCNLATVREPGFNVSGLGDIAGLSIPEGRGVIYRSNCTPDNYQAMVQ